MDINLDELQKQQQRISQREIRSNDSIAFNQQFFNVGHQNLQIQGNKEQLRVIKRFQGASISCFNLSLWHKIDINKSQIEKQFLLKDVSFMIQKEKVTGIYSDDNTSEQLLQFLSFQNPQQDLYGTYNLYLNDEKVNNIHNFNRMISYIKNQKNFDGYKTPMQIFQYFAQLNGYKNIKMVSSEVIELLGLQGCALTELNKIQRGQYKRCQIGAELIRNPLCLCLENPFNKLLYHEQLDLVKTLNRLAQRGLTIIFTFKTQKIQFTNYLSKTIILDNSQKFFEGTIDQLNDEIKEHKNYTTNNSSPLQKFCQIIDLKRFQAINYDISTNKYDQLLIDFQNERNKLLDNQNKKDLELKNQYFSYIQQISQTTNITLDLYKSKNKISTFQLIYFLYCFKIKTYIKTGFFQFSILKAIFILVLTIFSRIQKVRLYDNPIVGEQNIAGYAFAKIILFYSLSTQMHFKSLRYLYNISFINELKNDIYSRNIFLITIELLSFTMNLFIGTIFFFILKLCVWSFVSFEDFSTEWVFLIIGDMLIARDIIFFIVFFARGIPFVIINTVAKYLMFLTLGFYVQIKSMTWVFKWIMFFFPLRNIYQGLILNLIQNEKIKEKLCTINDKIVRDQYCNPFDYHNFYEKSIALNFIIFLGVLTFYKIIFFIAFYIISKEKQIIKTKIL